MGDTFGCAGLQGPAGYLNDPTISVKSKGILTRLLCKPDTWRLSVTYLVHSNKKGPSAIRTALKEFSIDQVVRAATKLVKTHRYNSMPTVADIINAMDEVVRINTEQRAEIEAGKVLEHLHYFGSQVTPSFDDPITKHLMSHRWRYH